MDLLSARILVPELQVLGWFSLGLGLVVEDKLLKVHVQLHKRIHLNTCIFADSTTVSPSTIGGQNPA